MRHAGGLAREERVAGAEKKNTGNRVANATRQGGGSAAVGRGRRRQGAVGATVTGAVGATVTGVAVVEVRAAVDSRPHSPGAERRESLATCVCGLWEWGAIGVGGGREVGKGRANMVECECGEGHDVIERQKTKNRGCSTRKHISDF